MICFSFYVRPKIGAQVSLLGVQRSKWSSPELGASPSSPQLLPTDAGVPHKLPEAQQIYTQKQPFSQALLNSQLTAAISSPSMTLSPEADLEAD